MTVFSIGDTNFDVDFAKSSISLEEDGTGMVELNIDIHGDDDEFMRLTEPDDAEWSWALYPPAFFLHGLRIPQGQGGAFAIGDARYASRGGGVGYLHDGVRRRISCQHYRIVGTAPACVGHGGLMR